MSLSDQLLRNGFKTHSVGIHGNEFTLLSGANAGLTFKAIDEVASVLNTTFELGDDPRELIVLHCADPVPPLDAQMKLSGLGANWIVVRRENNPSDSSTDFWARKLVPGKDT